MAVRKLPQDRDDLPRVSVIIPTYNYGHFVLAAIDSVRQQDYPNVEIIVIDDGSTDNTPARLARMDGIRYYRQDNLGLSTARNRGLSMATGKYLQFLDADDLIGRGSIRKRVEFLEQHLDYPAVICRTVLFRSYRFPDELAFLHKHWALPSENEIETALHYFNVAPPHAFLVRKSVVDASGLLFDPGLRACEDYDFWLRLVRVAGLPGMIKTCRVYYRRHAASMSHSYVNQHRHDAIMCKRILAATANAGPASENLKRADNLAAMLAAALMTARRLWHEDPAMFPDFVDQHVLPLAAKIAEMEPDPEYNAIGLRFLALARLTLARMTWRDSALGAQARGAIARALPRARSYLPMALVATPRQISVRTIYRILKLDVLNAWNALCPAANKSPKAH